MLVNRSLLVGSILFFILSVLSLMSYGSLSIENTKNINKARGDSSSSTTSLPSVIETKPVRGSASSYAQQSIEDQGILFSTMDGSQTSQIWKMGLDGNNKVRLTNDENHEQEWSRPSPNGKYILFAKSDKGQSVNFALESNEIWVMNIDGSNQHVVIDHAKRDKYGWKGLGHAEWSPDSSKMVLVATLPNFTSQLFVVDANGNNPEQITKTVQIDGQQSNTLDPSWSTTNQIVFVRSWGCLLVCANQDVFTMDYVTRVEKRITNDPNWNFDPYMSPDGNYFVWLSFRNSPIMCPCDLVGGNVNGALNPRNIIADDGTNANGTFSSDSKRLLFLKTIGFNQVLHRINFDGSGLVSLSPSKNGQSGIASYIPKSQTEINVQTTQTTTSRSTVQSQTLKPGSSSSNASDRNNKASTATTPKSDSTNTESNPDKISIPPTVMPSENANAVSSSIQAKRSSLLISASFFSLIGVVLIGFYVRRTR